MDMIFNAEVMAVIGNFLLGIVVVGVLGLLASKTEKEEYDIYYDDRYYTDYTIESNR